YLASTIFNILVSVISAGFITLFIGCIVCVGSVSAIISKYNILSMLSSYLIYPTISCVSSSISSTHRNLILLELSTSSPYSSISCGQEYTLPPSSRLLLLPLSINVDPSLNSTQWFPGVTTW